MFTLGPRRFFLSPCMVCIKQMFVNEYLVLHSHFPDFSSTGFFPVLHKMVPVLQEFSKFHIKFSSSKAPVELEKNITLE